MDLFVPSYDTTNYTPLFAGRISLYVKKLRLPGRQDVSRGLTASGKLPIIAAMAHTATATRRVMLLTTPRSYRLEAFRAAAERLGIGVITGIDLPDELADQWPGALALPFNDVATAVERIVADAAERPPAAILSVDDSGSLI